MMIAIYIAFGLFAWLIVAVMYYGFNMNRRRRPSKIGRAMDVVLIWPFLLLVALLDVSSRGRR